MRYSIGENTVMYVDSLIQYYIFDIKVFFEGVVLVCKRLDADHLKCRRFIRTLILCPDDRCP